MQSRKTISDWKNRSFIFNPYTGTPEICHANLFHLSESFLQTAEREYTRFVYQLSSCCLKDYFFLNYVQVSSPVWNSYEASIVSQQVLQPCEVYVDCWCKQLDLLVWEVLYAGLSRRAYTVGGCAAPCASILVGIGVKVHQFQRFFAIGIWKYKF